MSANTQRVDSAPVENAAEQNRAESVEVVEQEATAEVAETVEALSVEEQTAEETAVVEQEEAPNPRAEFIRMRDEFGAEIAGAVYASGGGYAEAKDAYFQAIKAENEALKSKLAAVPTGAKPASFAQGENKKPSFADLVAGKKRG